MNDRKYICGILQKICYMCILAIIMFYITDFGVINIIVLK